MAKKKKWKIKIPPVLIKIFLIGFFAAIIGFALYTGGTRFLTRSVYFKIKAIEYDASLQFINKHDLSALKGKSIFFIDLKSIQRRLQSKYPQLDQLKIIKRFPDQIFVAAHERHPVAQTMIKNKILTLDEKGVVLSSATQKDDQWPWIDGIIATNKSFVLGQTLRGKGVFMALKLIKIFQDHRALANYKIRTINVHNLSKITFTLSNHVMIIIDWDKMDRKINKLGFILSQKNINFKEIKYVDMRFKEPVVKKK